MKKLNIEKLYKTYERYYDDVLLNSKVPVSPKLSKREFEVTYHMVRNDRYVEMKTGERRTMGAITRDIALDQREYEMTMRQARARKKALQSIGVEDTSIRKLRTVKGYDKALMDAIRQYDDALKQQGVSGRKRALSISQYFFGS